MIRYPLLWLTTLLLFASCSPVTHLCIPDPLERYRSVRVGDSQQVQLLGQVEQLPADLQHALAAEGQELLTAGDSLQLIDFKIWLSSEFFLSIRVPEEEPPAALVEQYLQLADHSWRLHHILVEDSAFAAELAGDLTQGADFGQLAESFSRDPGSAPQGGELPPTRLGETVFSFEQTFLKLSPGEISGPVATPFGWHLIRLDSLRDGVSPPQEASELRAHLRRSLHNLATIHCLEELYRKHAVEIEGEEWSETEPVASWRARNEHHLHSSCWLPERGEQTAVGRRSITGGVVDSLLQAVFAGKIDPGALDAAFRRDFLEHYINQELLYREAVESGFCDGETLKRALQERVTELHITAALRDLLSAEELASGRLPAEAELRLRLQDQGE